MVKQNTSQKFINAFLSCSLLVCASTHTVRADDIELFVNDTVAAGIKPNILLILDNSGSMRRNLAGNNSPANDAEDVDSNPIPGQGESRVKILRDVITDIVEGLDNVNLGYMIFNDYKTGSQRNRGGHVAVAVKDIEDNRDTVALNIAAFSAYQTETDFTDFDGDGDTTDVIEDNIRTGFPRGRFTPLSETYYEALQYFQGNPAVFGIDNTTTGQFSGDDDARVGGTSTANYQSPITDPTDDVSRVCADNFIVMVTDGAPTRDGEADALSNTLLDTEPVTEPLNCGHGTGFSQASPQSNCLDDLAKYAFEHDFYDGGTADTRKQNVRSYMIGFGAAGAGIDATLLDNAAANGGTGEAFLASDKQTLIDSLNQIFEAVRDENSTFVAPAVPVNLSTGTANLEEVFVSTFEPSGTAAWVGNIKKYGLRVDPDSGDIEAFDNDNQDAINEDTGFIRDRDTKGETYSAYSFWTTVEGPEDGDGADAREGGFAKHIYDRALDSDGNPTLGLADSRIVISNLSGDEDVVMNADPQSNDLDDENRVHEDNDTHLDASVSATADLLGLTGATETEVDDHIKWARGVDSSIGPVNGDPGPYGRQLMGSSIHSRPVLVEYGTGGTDSDYTVFVGTTDGYLHAINGNADQTLTETTANSANEDENWQLELFSFIPRNLLANLTTVRENSAVEDLYYGLDGEITVWRRDINNDGINGGNCEVADQDCVMLFFGQRRGGKSYYALEVTDRTAPKLQWFIEGGQAGEDFEELGQSWSKPVYTQIALGTERKDVLVFAGGYDTNQDTPDADTDNVGRAIYIVDALTGEKLWSGGKGSESHDDTFAEMDYSIPSEVAALDLNGDDLIDRLMVGDMGGQVWRINIDNSVAGSLADRITGGVVADFSVASSDTQRRFYYPPDVALVTEGGSSYAAVSIGAGYRAHPLDRTGSDKFFLFKDPNSLPTNTLPAAADVIKEADLAVVNADGTGVPEASVANLNAGWVVELAATAGEKNLAESLILDGTVFFTTFTPPDENNAVDLETCQPNLGDGRFYAIDLGTGEVGTNPDGTPIFTGSISGGLKFDGIPAEPTVVVLEQEDDGNNPIKPKAQIKPGIGEEGVDVDFATVIPTYWYQKDVN